jgi:Tol biopolymer transport system component
MPLTAGTRLGPYEILAPIGAGGMGEVYRARDTRLDRSVAIKVLPQHLSEDPEVRARFEREARAVSQLNHPHICTLHDIGREGGTDFLVLEHVEGETLAARLERGALPVPELLRIGAEIADALEKAHRAGIVHRDLKPGNIMLTKSGAKLLDFGLARATGLSSKVSDLSSSPTVSHPLTAEGTILGTFHYMAPEQLEGREADARTDVWALGCVLYEMASGRRPFEGRSQASLIAAILEKDPEPIADRLPLVPPALDRLVQACLAKDPDERLQTAHDVRLQLRWIAEGGSRAGVPAPVAARRRSREGLAWSLAALAAVAAVTLAVLALLRPAPARRVVRFEIEAPPGTRNLQWPRLSPDGRRLAFIAQDTSSSVRVWIRSLDGLTAVPLAGTDGATRPFWSPDGQWLAFLLGGKVRRVPVGGGPAVAIGDAPGGADGTWSSRGLIAFDGNPGDSIRSIPASGGAVRPLSGMDRKALDSQHGWPFFLPDGRRFLYVSYPSAGLRNGRIRFARVGSFETRDLGSVDGRVEYAPEGYLVFPRENTLMAQPFDARSGRTTGDAVAIAEDVALGAGNGDFSVSHNGVLVYRTQRSGEMTRLAWMSRDGRLLGDAAPPGAYTEVALSPDGRRVALVVEDPQRGTGDLWVRDLDRGVTSRLTFDEQEDINPVWSPDGERIAFASDRDGAFRTFVRLASGVGSEDTLGASPDPATGPTDWSRDGRSVVLRRRRTESLWDILLLPSDGGAPPTVFLQTPFGEQMGCLSPDGRWMAYMSDESGRSQIYVRPASGSGGKWQVSVDGGAFPQWSRGGRELFFVAADQTLMAAPVAPGDAFVSGTPARLFRLPPLEVRYGGYRYAVAPDGQRVLVTLPIAADRPARFTVVENWTAELEKR